MLCLAPDHELLAWMSQPAEADAPGRRNESPSPCKDRSQAWAQVFNNTPDETAFFRLWLERESVAGALTMVQPPLLSYGLEGPPLPALLDVSSIQAGLFCFRPCSPQRCAQVQWHDGHSQLDLASLGATDLWQAGVVPESRRHGPCVTVQECSSGCCQVHAATHLLHACCSARSSACHSAGTGGC